MNLAISNIAWDALENEYVLKLLKKYHFTGVEIAPTKIWQNPTNISKADIFNYKKFWNKNGIQIIAMQSLLFDHPELMLFESRETRENMHKYLDKIIKLGAALGASALVFGSPKNRKKGKLTKKNADEIAADFFFQLGELAKNYDVHLCIESNPPVYGTDFLTTTKEVVSFIKKVNHPNINIHLDTGAMAINHEDYEMTIEYAQPFYHFHISEPQLNPVPQIVKHKIVAASLKKMHYNRWVSIEMRAVESKNHLKNVEDSLAFVAGVYQ